MSPSASVMHIWLLKGRERGGREREHEEGRPRKRYGGRRVRKEERRVRTGEKKGWMETVERWKLKNKREKES